MIFLQQKIMQTEGKLLKERGFFTPKFSATKQTEQWGNKNMIFFKQKSTHEKVKVSKKYQSFGRIDILNFESPTVRVAECN